LKPTYGRVSRSGLVAFGSTLDQVGTLSTTIEDAAVVLQAIAGHDCADATSSTSLPDDYRAACSGGVEGLRIGLPVEYFQGGLASEIQERVEEAARFLESHGAQVCEVSLPHTRYSVSTYYLLATAEASSNLARYDGVRYGKRLDSGHGLEAMYHETRGKHFGSEVLRRIMLGTYALSAGYHDAYYGKAQRARTLIRQDFVDCFNSGVDLLLTPTTPTTAFRLGEKVDDPLTMYLSDIYTATVNLAGLPAVSIPLSLSDNGLPIGGQLIAKDFDECALFRAAGVLQTGFPPLVPPPLSNATGDDS
jgi:aspartyl-tRNA(Asn)/glutamyl-tRNA(Gln) amidotransferase subunit A